MGVNAFVMRYAGDESDFMTVFLSSPDFATESLKSICRELNLKVSGKKGDLASQISTEWFRLQRVGQTERARRLQHQILINLIEREKDWAVFKTGKIEKFPIMTDPLELTIGPGEEKWYGPVQSPDSGINWYIRPVFVSHYELADDTGMPVRLKVRWLCFARVTDHVLSLHWRGFSYAKLEDQIERANSQFPYWEHVPDLYRDIEDAVSANVKDINLLQLVLYRVWEAYRNDKALYHWEDLIIRAQTPGFSMSARASSADKLRISGIRDLARTVLDSLNQELKHMDQAPMTPDHQFEDVILRAVIRELGALSYGFELTRKGEPNGVMFRGHCYFGQKTESLSPDMFAHINFYHKERPVFEQLQFLLEHLETSHEQARRHQ